ncbi:MAG: hypothetical protein ACJA1N_001440, partial [Saprospiraceae bacterium]
KRRNNDDDESKEEAVNMHGRAYKNGRKTTGS